MVEQCWSSDLVQLCRPHLVEVDEDVCSLLHRLCSLLNRLCSLIHRLYRFGILLSLFPLFLSKLIFSMERRTIAVVETGGLLNT